MQNTNTIVTWFENKEEELKILNSLQSDGYSCISCLSKTHFQEITKSLANSVYLIIIDLGLKDDDAIIICSDVKTKVNGTICPFVIIVSKEKEDYIQIMALDLGADDYIVKPINPRLLLKRIKAIFSRDHAFSSHAGTSKKDIFIDPERYIVISDGKLYKLPRKEFELMSFLYQTPNKIFSRKEIAAALWGDETFSTKRIIDVHVLNIRKLLGGTIIKSVKGKGYGLRIS